MGGRERRKEGIVSDKNKEAIDVGYEMARLLLEWRPEMSGEDVASAIMHALERYSIELEGPGETGLRVCLFKLREMIEERNRSI